MKNFNEGLTEISKLVTLTMTKVTARHHSSNFGLLPRGMCIYVSEIEDLNIQKRERDIFNNMLIHVEQI